LAFGVRSTKLDDDFTSSPGRKTQSVSVNVERLATSFTEGSSDVPDRYSLLVLALLTSGCVST